MRSLDQPIYLSIIIPVYNGEKTIRQCLDSLTAQDCRPVNTEIIVVDNKSTDTTRSIVSTYPNVILITENEIQGPSAARNTGAKHAQGLWILFFDADQVAQDDYLNVLFSHSDQIEHGVLIGRNIGKPFPGTLDGCLVRYWAIEWEKDWLLRELKDELNSPLTFCGGNFMIRTELFQQVGGFDTQLITCEDTDLAWRLQEKLDVKFKLISSAVAYHFVRMDLKSFLKREFYLGVGKYQLKEKYHHACSPLLWCLVKTLVRTIIAVPVVFLKLGKIILRIDDGVDLKLVVLDVCMGWSNCLGKVYCAGQMVMKKFRGPSVNEDKLHEN